MKLTNNVHIAKQQFAIEQDAYAILDPYLSSITAKYTEEEASDLLYDVELRIVELLADKGITSQGVITVDDITEIIAQLGPIEEPDESETIHPQPRESARKPKKLFRDSHNGKLRGVCSGVAQYFNIEASTVRLITIGLVFAPLLLNIVSHVLLGHGTDLLSGVPFATIIVYVILGIFLDDVKSEFSRMDASGKGATIENVADALKRKNVNVSTSGISRLVDTLTDIFVRIITLAWKIGRILFLVATAFVTGLSIFYLIASAVVSASWLDDHIGITPTSLDRVFAVGLFVLILAWALTFFTLVMGSLRSKKRLIRQMAYVLVGLIVATMAFGPAFGFRVHNFADRINRANHTIVRFENRHIEDTSMTIKVKKHQDLYIRYSSNDRYSIVSDAASSLSRDDRASVSWKVGEEGNMNLSFGVTKEDCSLCNDVHKIKLFVPTSVTTLRVIGVEDASISSAPNVYFDPAVVATHKLILEKSFNTYLDQQRIGPTIGDLNLDESRFRPTIGSPFFNQLSFNNWGNINYVGLDPTLYSDPSWQPYSAYISKEKRTSFQVPEAFTSMNITLPNKNVCLLRGSSDPYDVIGHDKVGNEIYDNIPVSIKPFDFPVTVNGKTYSPDEQYTIFCTLSDPINVDAVQP